MSKVTLTALGREGVRVLKRRNERKRARIKKNLSTNMENFRTINLTSEISKKLEILLRDSAAALMSKIAKE